MIRKHLKNLQKKHGEIAKKHRAFIFRLDPDVLVSDEEFKNIITELGYKTKKNIKSKKKERAHRPSLSRLSVCHLPMCATTCSKHTGCRQSEGSPPLVSSS